MENPEAFEDLVLELDPFHFQFHLLAKASHMAGSKVKEWGNIFQSSTGDGETAKNSEY